MHYLLCLTDIEKFWVIIRISLKGCNKKWVYYCESGERMWWFNTIKWALQDHTAGDSAIAALGIKTPAECLPTWLVQEEFEMLEKEKTHESIVFSSSDLKQAKCVVCSVYVYERLLTKTGSGSFLKLCLSEDLESDQWTLSCTKHQTLCPSYSLFFRPSTPLLSSFTCSLLCCALAHQNNKALMFHSTSPLFAATDLTKLHYKPESSILSGPIH